MVGMRVTLAALFLLAGSHGGSGCAHMGGAAGHAGNVGHPSLSSVHLPVASAAASTSKPGTVLQSAPHAHPGLGHALAAGIQRALAVGVDVIESTLGLDPGPDAEASGEALSVPGACLSVEDCGDGELGHGAVCDHWSVEPRSMGICREACRNDGDCPGSLVCHWSLDPDDASWGGCVERSPNPR